MNLPTTQFSSEGLNIGKDTSVMSYFYGLSDFWTYVFEDREKVNLMLESSAVLASDIYNNFLQLCTRISLENISVATKTQIKLVIINETSLVAGSTEVYTLGEKILSAKFLANRPFLPTATLEEGVGFFIDPDLGTVSFYKPLSQIGFPSRVNSLGQREYAFWAVDSKIDEQLIYNSFGKLLQVAPETSSDNFKNFVYGLYYLYTNGPNIELLRKGLNLVLGIPLARETETVLDIQTYLNTDQYIVITDLNSYVIPYGLTPTVAIGDTVNISDEFASWVEVKDYMQDGEWWLNFMIPAKLMPSVPPGETRYATAGSYADFLMSNYLKKHTFLVNVKTINFKNLQTFAQLAEIIQEVKPTYTTPVYVWTVPTGDETLNIFEEEFRLQANYHYCEAVTSGIWRFWRGSPLPIFRGCSEFTRYCTAAIVDQDSGMSEYTNGNPRSFNGGVVRGYISPKNQIRPPTLRDIGYQRNYFNRDIRGYRPRRDKIAFCRNQTLVGTEGVGGTNGLPSFEGYRSIYLHTTTFHEAQEKFQLFGLNAPSTWSFTLLKPTFNVDGINEHTIDGSNASDFYYLLVNNFSYLFNRGANVGMLGICPQPSYVSYTPLVSDVQTGDFLLFVHIDNFHVGVWWMTTNQTVTGWPYIACRETDTLDITVTGRISRGTSGLGSPYFFIRGGGVEMTYPSDSSIDAQPINQALDNSTNMVVKYSDTINPEQVITRAGNTLKMRIQR